MHYDLSVIESYPLTFDETFFVKGVNALLFHLKFDFFRNGFDLRRASARAYNKEICNIAGFLHVDNPYIARVLRICYFAQSECGFFCRHINLCYLNLCYRYLYSLILFSI